MVPAAYSQHEAGEVYLGLAAGFHVAPDIEDTKYLKNELLGAHNVDDGVLGWSAYGGYFVVDSLAIEAGYLGATDMDIRVGSLTFGHLSWSALYAAVAGYFPRPAGSTVLPFAKVGVARWDSDISFVLDADVADQDGTDPLLGAGFDIRPFGDGQLTFRGEWLVILAGSEEGGSHHRFQAGMNFTF